MFSQQVRKGANPEQKFDLMVTTYFDHNCETGQILTKPVSSTKLVIYSYTKLFKHFEAFSLKLNESSLFGLKIVYLRKKLRISQKLFFLNMFEKSQILIKNFEFMETTFSIQTCEKR